VLRWPGQVVLTSGARLELPARYLRSGSGAIYVFREQYEPEVAHLDRLVKPGMTFVDGGANIGIYSVQASALVGADGKVLSFEPAATAFKQLERNARLASYANISPFRAALSATCGEQLLYHSNGGPVGYSLGSIGQEQGDSEAVRTVRLDDVIASEKVDRVDVIKLDVEGAEELALRGGRATIEAHRPIVIFEYQPGAPLLPGQTHEGAWEFLHQLNYSLFRLDGGGALVPAAAPIVGNNIAVADS
jgi:FkbM family methyltransferase